MGEIINYANITVSENWELTSKLRFVNRSFNDFNNQLVGGESPKNYVKILQQLYVSNLGGKEWRDIPIEIENT